MRFPSLWGFPSGFSGDGVVEIASVTERVTHLHPHFRRSLPPRCSSLRMIVIVPSTPGIRLLFPPACSSTTRCCSCCGCCCSCCSCCCCCCCSCCCCCVPIRGGIPRGLTSCRVIIIRSPGSGILLFRPCCCDSPRCSCGCVAVAAIEVCVVVVYGIALI